MPPLNPLPSAERLKNRKDPWLFPPLNPGRPIRTPLEMNGEFGRSGPGCIPLEKEPRWKNPGPLPPRLNGWKLGLDMIGDRPIEGPRENEKLGWCDIGKSRWGVTNGWRLGPIGLGAGAGANLPPPLTIGPLRWALAGWIEPKPNATRLAMTIKLNCRFDFNHPIVFTENTFFPLGAPAIPLPMRPLFRHTGNSNYFASYCYDTYGRSSCDTKNDVWAKSFFEIFALIG